MLVWVKEPSVTIGGQCDTRTITTPVSCSQHMCTSTGVEERWVLPFSILYTYMRMRDGEQLIDLTAVNFIRFSTFLTETILQFDSTMEILMV